MAKAKSKKSKNVDFQKIKLKVGKRLTKGDNITNLSFKTRQIQLTQTIRTGETSLPVTKRNLSIQDLLRQCEHHSVGSRVNAIAGIKELVITDFSQFLVPSNIYGYGAIMKRISSMLIDGESDVRHSVINLFKLMFSKLKSDDKLNADSLMSGNLFSHIHAYMCCAMNHLHEDVRLDALVLFDALLDAFPHAMVQQTGDLLKNLISMISAPISIGAKGDMVTQRLSMNPDSKLPVMKFRARVLLRIKLTLQVAVLEVTDQQMDSSKSAMEGSRVWSKFSDNRYAGSKQNTLLVPQQVSQRFSWVLKGTAMDMQDYIIKANSLEEFIRVSIPILLQCWKEARASGPNDTVAGNLISSDALEVMSSVVGVIELLFTLSSAANARAGNSQSNMQKIPTSFLVQKYETNFTQDFMSHFPYSALIESNMYKKKKKKSKGQVSSNNVPTQSSLAMLNSCICHIMSCLCSEQSVQKQRTWLVKVELFLVRSFQNTPNAEHTRILIKILTNLFKNPSLIGNFSPVFDAACVYYKECKIKRTQKQDLFYFLAFVFKHWSGYKASASRHAGTQIYIAGIEDRLGRFLRSLPALSLRIPKDDIVDIEWLMEILSCISLSLTSPSNLCVAEKFKESLVDILYPLKGLIRIGVEGIDRQVVSLLALCPPLNKDQLKMLLYIIRRPEAKPHLYHRESNSLACQAITFVSYGIQKAIPFSSQGAFNQMTSQQRENLTDYLKFMFSLLIGMNREELESLTIADNIQFSAHWKSVCYKMEPGQWERHRDLVNIVCQELLGLQIPASPDEGYDQPFTFVNNIEQLWQHALTSYKTLHVMSAYSLFRFINCCSHKHVSEKPSAQLYKTASCVTANILVTFYLPDTKSNSLCGETVEQIKTEITSCLCNCEKLLPLVCQQLKNADSNISSNEGKQAAVQAVEFLLSVDGLKDRIAMENLLE